MSGEKEFIVTVKEGVDWQQIKDELTRDTSTDDSVDSNIVPDRVVDVAKLRSTNTRNTHYALTHEEAKKLRNDPRVQAVNQKDLVKLGKTAFQDGNFNKTTSNFGEHQNWGLLRHISSTNNFGTGTSDPGGTYDYVLDGTGVDVVIQDTGIQADHPEFKDGGGNSRLQQINWYTASGISGTQPANFYTDIDGHGTHVTGTVAGRNFGWAKNADIYCQTIIENSTGEISIEDAMDTLLAWHNAKTNGRPTVVNMSYGFFLVINTNVSPNRIEGFDGTIVGTIDGVNYRGTDHDSTSRADLTQYGLVGNEIGSTGYYVVNYIRSDVDADVQQLINAGIIVCVGAGNSQMKHDIVGGNDYNNTLRFTYSAEFGGSSSSEFMHRGSTPRIDNNPGFNVGALDSTSFNASLDQKATFSDAGPGVNIYTAGSNIMSALSNTFESGYLDDLYYLDSNFNQGKAQGTSMASPQIAGMAACLLQAHPDWTPSQVMNYFLNNSTSTIYTTGNDNDYTNDRSIWGATQRVAYFPMNGQRPFQYTSS